MDLFPKKNKFPLSDILRGIYNAVNSVQQIMHLQQVQNLTKFLQSKDGSPVTQKVKICSAGYVPLGVSTDL